MAMLGAQLLVLHELERRQQNWRARLLNRHIRDAQDPFQLQESTFMKHFRLNKAACAEFVRLVEAHMNPAQREGSRIPPVFRVLNALNFLATGSYQRNVALNVGACTSQSMASRNIREVIDIVVRYLQREWVQFPRNAEERVEVAQSFHRRHRMHHITGVVDGTHIAIVKPHNNEHVYVNRKGYHSLNCQIICDAELRILNVKASYPGSSHDAFIWRNSVIGQVMRANFENGDDSLIMGDSGYPCLPWLLVPLPHPNTPQEHRFNLRFKRCRSVVERCIGLLKGRFRCLLKERTLHYSPRMVAKIVLTCAVLHNLALHFRVEEPVLMWDAIDRELPVPADFAEQDAIYRQRGQERRQQYIQTYF